MAIDALFFEPDPTMRLDGGLDMRRGGRYLEDEPPLGRMVRFLSKNGWEHQLEDARGWFQKGEVLIVKEIYVGGSYSEVEFIEHPGIKFNTVMFEDLEVVK